MERDAHRTNAADDGPGRLPTYDETVLIGLLDGDEQMAAEVLRDFEAALACGADEIETAFRDNRTEQLMVAAHKLKSSSRTVGAMRLGELCGRLETGARDGPSHSVQRLILAVMAEMGAVSRRLRSTAR
jgi:HPt (histidine-containing phosphotransfer) domain-containing protein